MEKYTIKIDIDTADDIVRNSLKYSINSLRKNVDTMKKKTLKTKADKEDLIYCISVLENLKAVYEYYGGK